MNAKAVTAAVALAAAVVALPGIAQAKFTATGAGTAKLGAATMNNATTFKAVCRSGTSVTITWVISPDTYVDGYQISRSGPGGAQTWLLPRTTATMTDSGLGAGAYTYTIQAGSLSISWVTPALTSTVIPTFAGGVCTNK
jgi:hypothetical protein